MTAIDTDLWKEIWEKKGRGVSESIELSDLIAIDGFDTGAGEFSVQSWKKFVRDIQEQLKISPSQKILEVGCGAGAFLFPMYNSNINVYGVDYSKSLVDLCLKTMPSGVFKAAEAKSLPFDDSQFDAIVSNSVFQYFKNLKYAENVINDMARVLKRKGSIALLDINDTSKKREYESIRREKLGDDEYDKLYSGLSHQFYEKEWFEAIADDLNFECFVQNQNIAGYENSRYRYNVFLSNRE